MASPDNNLTYEFHDELNPAIWTDKKLDTEIKDKLLEIATAFLETIDIEVDVEDVTLTGSLANYNYTKYSDFDLHIITDYNDYDVDIDLLKDYFNAKKTVWNAHRDITIKGYDVEVYIQDVSEPHHSTGVYSLKNDEWISEPKPTTTKQDIDAELVSKKKQAMLDIINYALSSECDVECADKAKEKFMELRKAGLEKGGELSPENLAFKELRRSGDVERLVKGILNKKDKKLSLDSIQENSFKTFMGLGNKRGPRHQSLTAGVNKLVNPQAKTIGIVADMHKVQGHPLVHQLKKQNSGTTVIPLATANELVTMYGLNMNKIQNGEPRKLSTSNIELGYNPRLNTFYLRK
jgi:predicted nucleotidyltransferase